MASNNDWAPLPQRKSNNGTNKKTRAEKDKLVRQLSEMFGATFESDIIASVAQACNWKLEPAIDTLITLSSSQQSPTSHPSHHPSTQPGTFPTLHPKADPAIPIYDPWAAAEFPTAEHVQPDFPGSAATHQPDFLGLDPSELQQQQAELHKFEQAKCKAEAAPAAGNQPKVETASLCGLKVEYRPKGMENNSDDDADVVIEEESSDYRAETPEMDRGFINVCQFLATPVAQCPPKNTFPKVSYINTPSPPRTPRREPSTPSAPSTPIHDSKPQPQASSAALSRLESDILRGYKILVLMRGAPGSGKTHLARAIVTRTCDADFANHIFSSDDYFALINRGVYAFDASKLQDAHAYNQNRVINAMRQGWSPIIVDNTNSQAWEMQHYAAMAVDHGYIVETLEPSTPWSRNVHELDKRNRHQVPKSKIRAMLERYEANISGERLLRMFTLAYTSQNHPPQLRKLPPPPAPQRDNDQDGIMLPLLAMRDNLSAVPRKLVVAPSSQQVQNLREEETGSPSQQQQRRVRRPKRSLQTQAQATSGEEVTQVYDALSTIAKEYSNLETVASSATRSSPSVDLLTSSVEANDDDDDDDDDDEDAEDDDNRDDRKPLLQQQQSTLSSDGGNSESWMEGSSYKEDSLLDSLKLGAIGSERRVSTAGINNNAAAGAGGQKVNEGEATVDGTDSAGQALLKAIGSERRSSITATDDLAVDKVNTGEEEQERSEAEDTTGAVESNGLSQCWDFTLLLNGMQIHSKHDEEQQDAITGQPLTDPSPNPPLVPLDTSDDLISLYTSDPTDDSPSSPQPLPALSGDSDPPPPAEADENFVTSDKDSSIPSDKADSNSSNSSSSSLERVSDVDMSQFEICSSPSEAVPATTTTTMEKKEEEEVEADVGENQSTSGSGGGGLGSILSFIKNSFLGNEKEKMARMPRQENADKVDSSSTDSLTEKLRSSTLSNPPASLTSVSHDSTCDTLSPKLSNLTTTTPPIVQKNLVLESQGSIAISESDRHEDPTLELRDEVPPRERMRDDGDAVEELLLEASSDFQLVEQLDFTERRFEVEVEAEVETKTLVQGDEEEEEEEVGRKLVAEKNFVEQMKNLQVLVKFEEEDNKVSKEPIDKLFGGKNIFTEKMQNNNINSHVLASKPNNTSTNSLNDIGLTLDNVNLISWHESAFPLGEASVPEEEATIGIDTPAPGTEKRIESCDRETHTDPYDFNVAYVGGTDDYRVIEAVNRSINEDNRRSPDGSESPPSRVLMLHKGTMTSNTSVFQHGGSERLFELEIHADPVDRGNELVERYAHLPRACVLDVYETLCRRDYNWAADYLDNLQDDEATVCAAVELQQQQEQNVLEVEVESGIESSGRSAGVYDVQASLPVVQCTSESSTSSSLSSSPHRQPHPQPHPQPQQHHTFRSRRERASQPTDAQLALKRQLESKIVLSEESYRPHTLRVKRWKNREFGEGKKLAKAEVGADVEDKIQLELAKSSSSSSESTTRKPSRLDHPAMEEEDDDDEDEPADDEASLEDDAPEETIELKLGYEFIRILESEFGNGAGGGGYQAPDGLFPVIQIRKAMAQELHALWIESMQRQLWVMHEQLDAMIARDAEYARTLEAEEAHALAEPEEPNLKEIMDMEMALATYSNDCKQKLKKESHKDMAIRVTEQTLHEMFPDYDREMLHEIFEAHDRDFDETVKVIEENCAGKSTISMADVLKKRKDLIDELQKQSTYQTSRHNQLETTESRDEASGGGGGDEQHEFADYEPALTYEDAMELAHESREEARRQLDLRNENYQKADEHCRRKNPEVAAYYSDVAKLHIRSMELANATAASAFLAAQAHVLDVEDTVDLHNLRVEEALRALEIYLEHQLAGMGRGARKWIFIITGRGARSTNGQSRIKPAVARRLNKLNINFEEANPGMLKACLRKK